MTRRTVEDRLREEYFLLSPEINRVVHQLQTRVSYLLLPVTLDLKHHERIHIEARAKECGSAIGALRRRKEGERFIEEALREQTERVYEAFDELENTLERELQRDAELTTTH